MVSVTVNKKEFGILNIDNLIDPNGEHQHIWLNRLTIGGMERSMRRTGMKDTIFIVPGFPKGVPILPEQENLSMEIPIKEESVLVAVHINGKVYSLGASLRSGEPAQNAILVTELARRLVRTVQMLDTNDQA